jgi:uncharacterized protein
VQIHLDGSNIIDSPREKVFGMLTNPSFLAKTLPDAEDVRVLDDRSLEAKIKLRVAVVSSTLNMKMTVGSITPPSSASLLAQGTGSGSSIKITSLFNLEGDKTTNMKWTADAEITGVMAGPGSSLLKGFATKKVAEIFESLTKAIEAGAT